MSLLITGGCGFIGSHAVRYFLQQPPVHRLVNLDCLTYAGHQANVADVANDPKYAFEKVDLRNKGELQRVVRQHEISHVLHLAAESHVDRSIAGPDDFVHTNVVGTFHLLEACRAHWNGQWSGKRFHHVSTDEVYGSLGATGFFTETTPYAPNSPYSASKAASDMLVRAYHHTYGLPAVMTNCSNNYGPFQFPEKFIPVIIQSILERRSIPVYGDGLNVRDWLFVGDHVEALWLVLIQGQLGQTYNIGGQNEWPNLRIVEKLCGLLDGLAPHPDGPARNLIRHVKDRPGHDRRYAIDSSKIERELGWKPAHTFESGLDETVRWYRANQDWVRSVREKGARTATRHECGSSAGLTPD